MRKLEEFQAQLKDVDDQIAQLEEMREAILFRIDDLNQN